MRKIVDIIKGLRKYFWLSGQYKDIPKAEILSSNEALKAFGKIYGDHREDLMVMLTVIEYEQQVSGCTTEELMAMKRILGNVGRFFRGCSEEWEKYAASQAKKVH